MTSGFRLSYRIDELLDARQVTHDNQRRFVETFGGLNQTTRHFASGVLPIEADTQIPPHIGNRLSCTVHVFYTSGRSTFFDICGA